MYDKENILAVFKTSDSLCPLIEIDAQSTHECIGDACISIGAFDGVHLGHQFLNSKMIAAAKEAHLPSVILTFDIDPDELFKQPEDIHKLMSNNLRLNTLRSLGADYVVALKFSKELAGQDLQTFFEQTLAKFMKVRQIHVGCDFALGKNRSGNVDAIKAWAKEHECSVCAYDLVSDLDKPVSSTRIRRALKSGYIEEANELLGRPYALEGIVVHGRKAGRTFGIPTANIGIQNHYVLPCDGVYAGLVQIGNKVYPTALSAGFPPTFKDERILSNLELFILGFDQEIYEYEVKVSFNKFLRPMLTFKNTEEMKHIIQHDIDVTKNLLGNSAFEL